VTSEARYDRGVTNETTGTDPSTDASARRSAELGIIVSRWPKVNDMYQLREIVMLERLGMPIELFPLVRHSETHSHPEGVALGERAQFVKLASMEVVRAQLTWLRRNPRGYLKCWWWGITANLRAPDFLLRTFFIVPIAAAWALRMEQLGIRRTHAHFATYPAHAALVIKTLAGIPYSFTGHAHDLQIQRAGLEEKIRQADFVMTCTRHSRDVLSDLYGPEAAAKIHVVYHGVETDTYTPQPLPDDDGVRPFRVTCVAALKEYKGHPYLFRACAELVRRGIPVELSIVGDGPDRADLEALVDRLGLRSATTFTGSVASPDVRHWIEWSDVCCVASVVAANGQLDGIPNFLTESMAMGRPVVSTNLPGIAELITDGETGLMVPANDAPALADALERLRRDPSLRGRLASAGRQLVEAEHDCEVNTRRCFDIYSAALARTR
jgi:colanic acid/amylovoran biosynthesis glycosyltransferase